MSRNSSERLSSSKSFQIKQKNRKIRAISDLKEIFEESFIMGCAIKCGAALCLERKVRKSVKDQPYQRFTIKEVMVPALQQKINEIYEKWCNEKDVDRNKLYRQKDKSKTLQNISLNVLMDFFVEKNQKVVLLSTRRSNKNIKRERFHSFNDMSQDEIHEVGEMLCDYFIKNIPLYEKKTRKECVKIISSIPDDIPIDLTGNYHINSDYTNYQTNQTSQNEISQMNQDDVYVPMINESLTNYPNGVQYFYYTDNLSLYEGFNNFNNLNNFDNHN